MKILVIDDDADDFYLATRQLAKYGHETVNARTLREAVAFTHPCVVDAILSDVILPDSNSINCIHAFLGSVKIPSLVWTGSGSDLPNYWGHKSISKDDHESLAAWAKKLQSS